MTDRDDIHGEVTAVSPGYGSALCVHCGDRIHEAKAGRWLHDLGDGIGIENCGLYEDDDDTTAEPEEDLATCGACGRTWNDAIITGTTPAPSGRCPFEYDHIYCPDCSTVFFTEEDCDRHRDTVHRDKVAGHYMSPQARRRLANAIHGQEIRDLARDILEVLRERGVEIEQRESALIGIVFLIEGGADA